MFDNQPTIKIDVSDFKAYLEENSTKKFDMSETNDCAIAWYLYDSFDMDLNIDDFEADKRCVRTEGVILEISHLQDKFTGKQLAAILSALLTVQSDARSLGS